MDFGEDDNDDSNMENSIRYVGSQPWPFPQSCMLGFVATADDSAPLQIDENEITSAAWFSRADVADIIAIYSGNAKDNET